MTVRNLVILTAATSALLKAQPPKSCLEGEQLVDQQCLPNSLISWEHCIKTAVSNAQITKVEKGIGGNVSAIKLWVVHIGNIELNDTTKITYDSLTQRETQIALIKDCERFLPEASHKNESNIQPVHQDHSTASHGKLKLIMVEWATSDGHNKSWKTQPNVEVLNSTGVSVARMGCCSAARPDSHGPGDKWDDGTIHNTVVDITDTNATYQSLLHGSIIFRGIPHEGDHDTWYYSAVARLSFQDTIISKECNANHDSGHENTCKVAW